MIGYKMMSAVDQDLDPKRLDRMDEIALGVTLIECKCDAKSADECHCHDGMIDKAVEAFQDFSIREITFYILALTSATLDDKARDHMNHNRVLSKMRKTLQHLADQIHKAKEEGKCDGE